MRKEGYLMIPKKIHYCWFGGNPLPELAQKCIASWKKYCPDYEIVEWNETNFDINYCDYVREAYTAKKMGVCFGCCSSICARKLWRYIYGHRCRGIASVRRSAGV